MQTQTVSTSTSRVRSLNTVRPVQAGLIGLIAALAAAAAAIAVAGAAVFVRLRRQRHKRDAEGNNGGQQANVRALALLLVVARAALHHPYPCDLPQVLLLGPASLTTWCNHQRHVL